MRKAVGPLLKVFAFLVLVGMIAALFFIADPFSSLGIPEEYKSYLLVGLVLASFFLFLLLYAKGQSVQSLVEIAESQSEARSILKEIAGLLRERPMEADYESLSTPELAPAQPIKDWRRPAPASQAPAPAVQAPPPVAPASKPKIACSLCGAVQDAGQASCVQCGATFVTGASL